MSIKAIFPAGVTAITVNGLHQWDYGQKLDIEAADLPLLIEVHFACAGMDEAVVRVCQVKDGKTSAVIPDACLEQRSPVVAWVYMIDEAGGKTILTVTMPVIARIKPPAGTSSPQVADQYAQLIALVNDQMDALFSGDAPVGRAFEADHAAAADHATGADHAAAADHATSARSAETADNASHANRAAGLDEVLPVSRGGTGADNVEGALLNLGIGTYANAAQGSYKGTGTWGEANPCSLTLDFVPKIVFITNDRTGTLENGDLYQPMILFNGLTRGYHSHIIVSWSGTTVSWYHDQQYAAEGQFNSSGKTYHWVAIG